MICLAAFVCGMYAARLVYAAATNVDIVGISMTFTTFATSCAGGQSNIYDGHFFPY